MPFLKLFFALACLACLPAHAQTPRYVDYKPQYKQWRGRFLLDKITYFKERTVFHFRYAGASFGGSITFYGPENDENRWTLVNLDDPTEQYPLIELKTLRKEVYTLYDVYRGDNLYYKLKPYEIYTVEVHFPALPKHITRVDFLEGVTKRSLGNHFHCLNVRVKPFDDPELGTEADMKERIDAFEIRTLGWAKTSLNLSAPPAPPAKPVPPAKPADVVSKVETKPTQPKPKPQECAAQGREE